MLKYLRTGVSIYFGARVEIHNIYAFTLVQAFRSLLTKWSPRIKYFFSSAISHTVQKSNLAFLDFAIFSIIKSQINGVTFEDSDELKHAIRTVVSRIDSSWYSCVFVLWLKRQCCGDYVEKKANLKSRRYTNCGTFDWLVRVWYTMYLFMYLTSIKKVCFTLVMIWYVMIAIKNK